MCVLDPNLRKSVIEIRENDDSEDIGRETHGGAAHG